MPDKLRRGQRSSLSTDGGAPEIRDFVVKGLIYAPRGRMPLAIQTRGRLNLTNIWPRQARIYGRQGIFLPVGRLWACETIAKQCPRSTKFAT
jgi:hypothetical protein